MKEKYVLWYLSESTKQGRETFWTLLVINNGVLLFSAAVLRLQSYLLHASCADIPQSSHVAIVELIVVVSAASGRSLLGASHTHFAQITLRARQAAFPEDLAVDWMTEWPFSVSEWVGEWVSEPYQYLGLGHTGGCCCVPHSAGACRVTTSRPGCTSSRDRSDDLRGSRWRYFCWSALPMPRQPPGATLRTEAQVTDQWKPRQWCMRLTSWQVSPSDPSAGAHSLTVRQKEEKWCENTRLVKHWISFCDERKLIYF